MDIIERIVASGLWLFALLHFLAQFAAKEFGYWVGRGAARRGVAPEEAEAAGFIVTGMLGLLAFTMAIAISFAGGRAEARLNAAVAEANAIGTAWLRAHAVAHPRGPEIARELEAYIAIRRAFVAAPVDPPQIAAIQAASDAAQTRMWSQLQAITAERTDPVAVALMAALNDTFDAATTQRQAFAVPMPRELVALLLGISVVSIGLIGYQFGLRGRPRRLIATLLLATWTAALVLVADFSAARIGEIRVNPAVYDWTAQGFAGGVPAAAPLAR
jgi:hypothetical protein